MTDLVVVSLEAWDEVWRRNQHLVAGLLATDPELRVLFVEPSVDPLHVVRSRQPARVGRGLRRAPDVPGVGDGRLWLYEPTKWLPRRVDRGSDARWSAAIARIVRTLGFGSPLLWVNSPSGAQLLRDHAWPALYDITDDWLLADRPPAEHDRLARDESWLLEHCREVVVCSPRLLATKSTRGVLTLVQNAVDLDAYLRPSSRPADLPSGRVALYVGTVHTDRMDVDLCEATARSLDELGRLVLVGPDLIAADARARLSAAGVSILGARPFDQVPAYLQHADLLVVPHVADPFTDSLDPIKVYEYRAARRPILSTPVAGFRELAGPAVRLASGPAFADAARELLSGPLAEVDSGSVPSWRDRVASMREVLDRLGSGQ